MYLLRCHIGGGVLLQQPAIPVAPVGHATETVITLATTQAHCIGAAMLVIQIVAQRQITAVDAVQHGFVVCSQCSIGIPPQLLPAEVGASEHVAIQLAVELGQQPVYQLIRQGVALNTGLLELVFHLGQIGIICLEPGEVFLVPGQRGHCCLCSGCHCKCRSCVCAVEVPSPCAITRFHPVGRAVLEIVEVTADGASCFAAGRGCANVICQIHHTVAEVMDRDLGLG